MGAIGQKGLIGPISLDEEELAAGDQSMRHVGDGFFAALGGDLAEDGFFIGVWLTTEEGEIERFELLWGARCFYEVLIELGSRTAEDFGHRSIEQAESLRHGGVIGSILDELAVALTESA